MKLAELENRMGNISGVVEERTHGSHESDGERQSGSSRNSSGSTEVPSDGGLQVLQNENNMSSLTIDTVAGGRKDFKLQNVDPFFNDPSGRYYSDFEKHLDTHMDNLSSDKLCVEDYLKKSEKDWFGKVYDAKLGKPMATDTSADEFQLNHNHVAPTKLRKLLQKKVGDWPIYTFLLAFGQIIAANSCKFLIQFPSSPNFIESNH